MTSDQRKEINGKLNEAALQADSAMQTLAVAAAMAATSYHFHLAKNILDKAIMANDLRAGALGTVQQDKA